MISVVILTLNEADNLPRCLASVAWCDDVLVVDSGSTDQTCAIAQAAGARVVSRPFDSFAGQRNFAMENGAFKHSWVLHLDADEVVTPALADELRRVARNEVQQFKVWRVASRMIFMGKWLRRAGMFPAYQVRFGQADALRFVDVGHGQREVQTSDEVGTLRHPLDHYNFSKGINDWLSRHLRYARAEALQQRAARSEPMRPGELFAADSIVRRRALKRLSYRLPMRGLIGFLYIYLLRGGWLDGLAGLRYAQMYGLYQSFIALNAAELACRSDADADSVKGRAD